MATAATSKRLSPTNLGHRTDQSGTRLLIVGGGMATHGLCSQLVSLGTSDDFSITIFGDEKHLCYDRVNLSQFFDGKSADDLVLSGLAWYEEHKIQFRTGHYIAKIDRENRLVYDQRNQAFEYDKLVIATGSAPWLPPIPGIESKGVFVYRTLADLEKIKQHVIDEDARVGAVLGGGLLGLESAKVLKDLGLKTCVVEMAPGLMPKQLDATGADRLKQHVESTGVDVHLVRRTERIVEKNNQLEIQFSNADPLSVDVLIVATGVRPNDQLAHQSGLAVGPRGGIVVDYQLRTSDPDIFAIGECVSFQDHCYGLVAPCYRMADVLARRLAGEEAYFIGADESAELKLLGIPVVVIGRAIGESSSCVVVPHDNPNAYRKIIMEQGRFAGAACVGQWDELPLIRHAIHQNRTLWPTQRARFQRTGSPWIGGGNLPVVQWPMSSVICSCLGVTKGDIEHHVENCEADVDQIIEKTNASTACGSCRSLVCELAGSETQSASIPGGNTMFVASVLGLLFAFVFVVSSPIAFADSVQAGWRNVDILWRSDLARQITGFTTVGLLLLGLVFSLRKRFSWFQFGSYGLWRALHGVLGTLVVVALAVHTGFRLGDNLNFVLGTTFLATAVIGTLAGVLSSLETKLTGTAVMAVRQWRPRLTRIHTWLFWPLPALIIIHVITFYWFSD